jgi:hypothetical protein
LRDSVTLPIVKFQRISGKLPALFDDMSTNELSTDQRYLYEMCESISKGVVSQSLADRNPGNLSHSRWLTLANNVLRTYVGTQKPSNDLKAIVTFIIKVYAPSWFHIKINCKCFDGAPNLFHFIKATRYLQPNYREVVEKSIQNNSFYAHPENMLIAMLCDEDISVRYLAYQRIVAARSVTSTIVRQFQKPTINFNAKKYYDLIDWNKIKTTEPPLTKKLSDNDLQLLVKHGRNSETFKSGTFKYPCHTQSVERCVKLVTEASIKVADELRRDGYIRTIFESRATMPEFNKKNDFRT